LTARPCSGKCMQRVEKAFTVVYMIISSHDFAKRACPCIDIIMPGGSRSMYQSPFCCAVSF
jgi:hypothetical protein